MLVQYKMASSFLAKRSLVIRNIIFKPIHRQALQSLTRLSFSSASERPEGGNIRSEEAEGGDRVAGTTAAAKETTEQGRFEGKGGTQDIANDTTSGMADYMADVSRDKAVKSLDMTSTVGDTAQDMPHLNHTNDNESETLVGRGH